MIVKSLFEYSDYKLYLNDLAKHEPRGFKRDLAQKAKCQTAYVSHVLNSSGQFNLEQVEAIARHLGLGKEETRYFLVLVEYNRAGTPSLRQFLYEQIEEMRERHLLLKKQVGIQTSLTRENQNVYYSSWHYAAIHMAVTVPALQTRKALSKALKISARKLNEVLEFLISTGILNQRGEVLSTGSTLLHLEKDSPLIFQHHLNWRTKAMASLHDENIESSIHYSSVVSLSESDVQKIRYLISQNLSSWISVVKDSKEEQVYGLCLDFFRVD